MEMNGRTAKTIFGGTAPKRSDGSSWHNADGILDNWSKREWSDGLQIESLEDLAPFDPEEFVEALLSTEDDEG